jgi:hypothetical protein
MNLSRGGATTQRLLAEAIILLRLSLRRCDAAGEIFKRT